MKFLRILTLLLLSAVSAIGQVVIVDSSGRSYIIPSGTYRQVEKPITPPVLPNCGCSGPDFSIVSIRHKTESLYEVKFDACNVTPLSWTAGNKASTFFPISATFTADLSGLKAGEEYEFRITSTGCKGTAKTKVRIAGGVDPPKSRVQFIANGTGNSVDFNAENGISNNFPDQFQAFAENGIDVIRLVFSVGSYHPTKGVYRNEKLSDAIRWIRSLPNSPKVDLLFVPTFPMNDIRFSESELYRDSQGNKADCTFGLVTFPSYYSKRAGEILNEAYDELVPYLVRNHSGDINDLSFAGGTSEEHYMPHTANYPGGPGCGGGYGGIGDYSQSARDAWREWLMDRYGPLGDLPYKINGQSYKTWNAALPYIPVTSGNNYNLDFGNPAHRDVTRFWNQGVLDVWLRFRSKVKQYSGFPVEYFVADMFNEQGIRWLFNAGTMAKAMQLCDVWYHTYNHSPDDWGHNLVGTDVLLGGSFGSGKQSAIEYDSFDLGAGGDGGALDVEHLKKSGAKFIEHGGTKIHFAMNWNRPQIDQIGQGIRWLRENMPTVKSRESAPVVTLQTHNLFTDSDFIDSVWESAGNSVANPYAARIMNVRIEDTFWTLPK